MAALLTDDESDGTWKVASAIWNSDLATAGLWSGAGLAR
jgi:hypothetical protein